MYRSVLGQATNYFLRKFPNDAQNTDRLQVIMENRPTYDELLFYLVVSEILLAEYVAIDFCERYGAEQLRFATAEMYYWFMEKLTKIAAAVQGTNSQSRNGEGKLFDGANSRRLRELIKARLQADHDEKIKLLRSHLSEREKKLLDDGIREPFPKVEWKSIDIADIL